MASASAQNLLGLMSQLQSLEASFISVLMEAALKLSAITGHGKRDAGKTFGAMT